MGVSYEFEKINLPTTSTFSTMAPSKPIPIAIKAQMFLLALLFISGGDPKCGSSMMPDAVWLRWPCKIIHTIIVNCILPMSSRSFVNHQHTWLIYHYIRGIKVNFVRILIESLFEASTKSKIPHDMLICHLMFRLDVIGSHFNINTLVRPKRPWTEARWKSSNFELKIDGYWLASRFLVAKTFLF